MVAEPEEAPVTPVTIPVKLLTVAFEVLLLDQDPDEMESDNWIVVPVQTDDGPVITDGEFTIATVVVAIHPATE